MNIIFLHALHCPVKETNRSVIKCNDEFDSSCTHQSLLLIARLAHVLIHLDSGYSLS